MEIQHFIHDHPLIVKEIEQKNKYSPLVFCSLCDGRVIGLSYSCNQCQSDFTLHKSCAELPGEIQHPSHRQHPLILYSNRSYRCDGCRQNSKGLLHYSCSECNFDLDIKCASNWRNIESDSHDHNFSVIRKPKGFTCDTCGEHEERTFYLCSICQLLVHKDCTSIPRHIKITSHQHPLALTWHLQAFGQRARKPVCKLCGKPMGENRADYCCQPCSFNAHFRCAIKHIENVVQDETSTESAAQQVKHFSHQHVLALTTYQNEVLKDDEGKINICEACIRPITTEDAFYRCTEEDCHFFLHTTCAQLPTMRLPSVLHLHQLTLLPSSPSIDTVFECRLCKTLSQGFAYYCDKCNFYYDLPCTMLSDSLKHESPTPCDPCLSEELSHSFG